MPKYLIDTSPFQAEFHDGDPVMDGASNLAASIIKGAQARAQLRDEAQNRNFARTMAIQRFLSEDQARKDEAQYHHDSLDETKRHHGAIEQTAADHAKASTGAKGPRGRNTAAFEPIMHERKWNPETMQYEVVTRPKTHDEITAEYGAIKDAEDQERALHPDGGAAGGDVFGRLLSSVQSMFGGGATPASVVADRQARNLDARRQQAAEGMAQLPPDQAAPAAAPARPVAAPQDRAGETKVLQAFPDLGDHLPGFLQRARGDEALRMRQAIALGDVDQVKQLITLVAARDDSRDAPPAPPPDDSRVDPYGIRR